MKIIEIKKIDTKNHNKITFIKVESENSKDILQEIFHTLSDLSWIYKFDKEYIRNSFSERAKKTVENIYDKFFNLENDPLSSDAGEYVVSEISRKTITNELNYLDIPLSELFNKKKSGNPGFDFYSQNDSQVIIFGEAKYIKGKNAYSHGLKQVIKFIEDKKDIIDLVELDQFCDPIALENVDNGVKGFAIGFSINNSSNQNLISNIIKNPHYQALLKHHEIILVAVKI
jgi:hypothetical protein